MKKRAKVVKNETKIPIRLKVCLSFGFILLFILLFRLAWLQFIQRDSLKESADKQQITSRIITPRRGALYDSTGKALAISADVDTISINPTKIEYSNGQKVPDEILSQAFSNIFGLDYTETLQKISNASSIITIAQKVEQDKVDLLSQWMKDNKVTSGINIDGDTKRYYPYENLASNLIGFTGTDGNGLLGLEYTLNSRLSGVSGKIVTATDSVNDEIPNERQTYIAPQNGNDVSLTIDVNIQSIAEKYLSQAVNDNNADGGNVIIMNPSNGDVLAMATYPDYNLNTPFTPTTKELTEKWDTLSSEEKNTILYSIWNNTAVQNTYEPGSTFKLITTATALEENVITTDNTSDFICNGYEMVDGIKINCWRSYDPHGKESLRQALANSCNPAFIQLGKKIGATTLYKYYHAFGLFDKTNPDFYGESNSVFYNLDNVSNIELATMSFGQRFTITPLQLITSACAIANEGVLVTPRIVKEIKNTDTGAVTTCNPVEIRQVISKETAETMMDLTENVVTNGTGKYAKVSGYSVGGKSGTSEPLSGSEDKGYVASFIGFSPTVNTQVVILVTIYHPKGNSYQGGQVAGPVVSQILSEVLPYLGVASENSQNTSSDSSNKTTILPDVTNKTIAEAKDILKNAGFNVQISSNEDINTTLIVDQVPKPGVSLISGSTIFLYTQNNNTRVSTVVPNLKGMSAAQAINSVRASNLNIVINGSGIVISQDIASR